MQFLNGALIILGLAVFEIVSSIDNAVINAEILDTMSERGRKWFLLWGFLFAVIIIRGLLPWAIIWAVNPGIGPVGALTATFSGSAAVAASIARSSPVLLLGGGMFLLFLFFHWLFLEPKTYGLPHEAFFFKNGVWFSALVSVIFLSVAWSALRADTRLVYGTIAGPAVFFIMQGFKENAERAEMKMMEGKQQRSDLSKILYLEIIDASFSIDGILGAFAFTLSVPYILIGNGIGAYVLRTLTVNNIDRIKKYVFLKNGAMYAIFALSIIMLVQGFGHPIPEWVSPLAMFAIVGFFFLKSRKSIADQA